MRRNHLNLLMSALPLALLMCTACSSAPAGKEAEARNVTVLPGTYAVTTMPTSNDPTCAENFGDIVGHLEYLMAQKNSGQAAVSP